LTVKEEESGQRIDRYLSGKDIFSSRAFLQKLIKADKVKVNGTPVKASYKLESTDEIEVDYAEPQPLEVQAEDLPLEILYEDGDLIVINKPRGMVVHPAAGNSRGTLVNALLAHCHDLSGIGGVIRPGIVHRLDKDTSGVLVAAKNDRAHLCLAKQLKDHTMIRRYLALVHGRFKEDAGRIDAPIGRHPVQRKKMAVVAGGKPAITHYRVLEELGGYTLVELRLETGRTHQIRVHMRHIGHPVAGDQVYGRGKEPLSLEGQALHAAVLGFCHPRTGDYLEFSAAMPEVMEKAVDYCRRHPHLP
jgi:23S rRNA pseudouridine1911/1915/1917 synthase